MEKSQWYLILFLFQVMVRPTFGLYDNSNSTSGSFDGSPTSMTVRLEITAGSENEDATLKTRNDALTEDPQLEFLNKVAGTLRFKIGVNMQKYYLPVVIVIGWVGNSISFRVMTLKANKRLPCSLYLAALAFSDNIVLTVSVLYWALTVHENYMSTWTCKIPGVFFTTFSTFGEYLIVALTIDRLLAVAKPLKARVWVTMSRTKLVVALGFLFSVLFHTPIWYTMDVVEPENICLIWSDPTDMFSIVYSWVTLCLIFLVVHSVLSITNIVIIRTVVVANRKRREKIGSGADSTSKNPFDVKKDPREAQMMVLLLATCIGFLLLTVPAWIMDFIYSIYMPPVEPEPFATYFFTYHFTQKMFITNSSVNFFLYCIGGSKFRSDARRVLGCSQGKNLKYDSNYGGSSGTSFTTRTPTPSVTSEVPDSVSTATI